MKDKNEKEREKNKHKTLSGLDDIDPAKMEDKYKRRIRIIGILFGFIIAIYILISKRDVLYSAIGLVIVIGLSFVFAHFSVVLKRSARIKKMEGVFPDFLQLVSSNLRAGITVDKAILLSAREEFAPLDEEIMRAGKDITTGKSMEIALQRMSERVGSDKIDKTIMLINSGLKSGGNLSVLLEQTASSMREREFVEKRSASNVMMYVIFIFVAVAVGAPALFSLSTLMVQVMSNMVDSAALGAGDVDTAFSFSSMNISISFLVWFSVIFIFVIDILACLIIGLVSKGDEKAGLRYFIPLVTISMTVFFSIRALLNGYVSGLF